MEFSKLFTPIRIRNMELPNRIVMLPMTTGFVEPDGTAGDRFIEFFVARAKGGAGLIDIPVTPVDGGGRMEAGLFEDRFLPGLHRLTSGIHAWGAKTAAQLIISYAVVLRGGRSEIVAPSPIFNKMMHCVPRELEVGEIRGIVAAFGAAACRARRAGFDAVEVLVGAGYLLNRFLSPISNERKDDYGGTPENRRRILLEIIDAIKKEAGDDFPIICRLNVEEQMPGGLTIEDSRETLGVLEKSGVAMISTYTGWHESPVPTVASCVPKGAFAHLSQKVKEYVSMPVIASNRINDPFTAERILSEGKADLIGMARPLLADPELPNKAREGRTDEIIYCLACTECLAQTMMAGYRSKSASANASAGPRSLCSLNPCAGKEAEASPPAGRKKRVFIIGAGPAGMSAALTAAGRGHDVTVFDKGSEPGGRLLYAALPPFKDEIGSFIRSLHTLGRKAGVTFRFNTEVRPEWVAGEKPDVVILAAGAEPMIPPIAGIDGPRVVMAEDVLAGRTNASGAVVVIGGGLVGCETADFLVARGATDVTVVEMLGRMADNVTPSYRPFFLARLKKEGVKLEANTTVTAVTDEGVRTRKEGGDGFMPARLVVLAAGYKANRGLIERFSTGSAEFFPIGDCVQPRKIKDAVEEGYAAGRSI